MGINRGRVRLQFKNGAVAVRKYVLLSVFRTPQGRAAPPSRPKGAPTNFPAIGYRLGTSSLDMEARRMHGLRRWLAACAVFVVPPFVLPARRVQHSTWAGSLGELLRGRQNYEVIQQTLTPSPRSAYFVRLLKPPFVKPLSVSC